MKIISNYKDYYDYLQKGGIDEKVVYDRRTSVQTYGGGDFEKIGFPMPEFIKDKDTFNFNICGNLIRLRYEGNDKDIDRFDKPLVKGKFVLDTQIPMDGKFVCDKNMLGRTRAGEHPNIKYDCPVILSFSYYTVKNPKLSMFGFGKFMSAETIYQLLYDWNSTNVIPEDNRTDKEKIQGGGFDYKHSFRNTK